MTLGPGPRIALSYAATPDSMGVVHLAEAAAERGFDGVFLPEHTHIPVSRETPFPGGMGIPMPEHYKSVWDPYIALTAVAARTDLFVGTCVALVGQHDPISLAKAIATLDVLSGGRLVLGVGYGWNREEFEDHGHPRGVLRDVVREKVQLMRALWTQDVASFAGEHVSLSPSWSWPKPTQRPHPPVLLGVPRSAALFADLVAWADGWLPMGMPTADELAADLAVLRPRWEAAGRDPATLHLAVMQWADGERIARERDRFGELGWLLVAIPTASSGEILPVLDSVAAALDLPPGRPVAGGRT